jgi:hypothetical protein
LLSRFDDEIIQQDRKLWSFNVVPGSESAAAIEVKFRGETITITPEEVSAAVTIYYITSSSDPFPDFKKHEANC